MRNRIIALGMTLSIALAGLAPIAARANENGAKNAAIGATALSAYLLMHRNTRTAGLVGAAGSAYLWKKYSDSRHSRRNREIARENYYRRAAANNARAARYYRSRYTASRYSSPRTARYSGRRSYRSSRIARR